MSWEVASVLVTTIVGVLPLVLRWRKSGARMPVEQSWTLSVSVGRRRR